jgi:hypothetical protein
MVNIRGLLTDHRLSRWYFAAFLVVGVWSTIFFFAFGMMLRRRIASRQAALQFTASTGILS